MANNLSNNVACKEGAVSRAEFMELWRANVQAQQDLCQEVQQALWKLRDAFTRLTEKPIQFRGVDRFRDNDGIHFWPIRNHNPKPLNR